MLRSVHLKIECIPRMREKDIISVGSVMIEMMRAEIVFYLSIVILRVKIKKSWGKLTIKKVGMLNYLQTRIDVNSSSSAPAQS